MRRKYDPNELSKYRFPNLVAEYMESGYSICTLSEHMGLGRREEDDPLMKAKIFGNEEILFSEAVGLTKLFDCSAEYLFRNELTWEDDKPMAYCRHYLSNKLMERDMEIHRVAEALRIELKEKPYLIGFMKYVLSLSEQQVEQMIKIIYELKTA